MATPASSKNTPHHGFLLITVDPPPVNGVRTSAWSLVRHRLERGRWPLFVSTRNRRVIDAGSRLAFYVAGGRENSGRVMAISEVSRKLSYGGVTDPPQLFLPAPDQVLVLQRTEFLQPAPRLRDVVERLSFRPERIEAWGVVLIGGCRALSLADWNLVVGRE